MHVVIISRSYPNKINPSSGNFVLNQVEALAKHNIKLGVVGVYNASLKQGLKPTNIKKYGFYKEEHDNVINYSYLYPVLPKMHYLNHRIKFRIWKNLLQNYIDENGKPDLIHLHTFEGGEIAIWAKQKFGIPYIVTEHTTLFYTNKALKWHIKLADKVYKYSSLNLAVSKASSSDLSKRFNSEFQYFPNFIDINRFQKTTPQEKEFKQFINIAFLDPKKNQIMLIEAFHKAFNNDSNYRLKIVGNGPEKSKLLETIKKLGNENIILAGYLPQEKVVETLQESDYFALSSNYETFGVVIVEAMSCGLPVIATKCGGPETIIINEKLGILTDVGDTDAFSKSLKKLIDINFDTQYIRNYAIDNYSYEALSIRLIELYKTSIR
jgi:glycosyltransferase involved in cell wall biosynthesis